MALTSITPHAARVYVSALLTTNISSLSGAQTIDGVALTAGMLCGAIGQTSATTRAIYVVQSGAWLIADPGVGTGLEVYALNGTLNKNTVYGCDTTGAIVWGTTSVTFAQKSSAGAVNSFAGISLAIGGGPAASRLGLTTGDFATLAMYEPSGGAATYGVIVSSATASSRNRLLTISLADDASVDITTTVGGFAQICAPATANSGGFFSFLADGTPSLNGLTFTTLVAADTDNKLCVFASGGKLRIRNRLGSTQVITLDITEGLSA